MASACSSKTVCRAAFVLVVQQIRWQPPRFVTAANGPLRKPERYDYCASWQWFPEMRLRAFSRNLVRREKSVAPSTIFRCRLATRQCHRVIHQICHQSVRPRRSNRLWRGGCKKWAKRFSVTVVSNIAPSAKFAASLDFEIGSR